MQQASGIVSDDAATCCGTTLGQQQEYKGRTFLGSVEHAVGHDSPAGVCWMAALTMAAILLS